MNDEDDWDDQLDEREFGDQDELYDDDSETVACPECGVEIYEDSEQCPACGAYVVHRHSIWEGKSLWWILLGALGVLATVLTLLGV